MSDRPNMNHHAYMPQVRLKYNKNEWCGRPTSIVYRVLYDQTVTNKKRVGWTKDPAEWRQSKGFEPKAEEGSATSASADASTMTDKDDPQTSANMERISSALSLSGSKSSDQLDDVLKIQLEDVADA